MGYFGLSVALCIISATIHCLFNNCSARNVPALFVFGDSMVDVGNNLYRSNNTAIANFPPYGIDFGKPTGRFTNGRQVCDILAQEIGLKNFAPPYLAPTTVGDVILKGANFGSAGSGILKNTGQRYGNISNFDTQINYYAKARQEIISMAGARAGRRLICQAIHYITFGSNDLILDSNSGDDLFLKNLISKFKSQLSRLYKLGATKIVVTNAPPYGCAPGSRDRMPFVLADCIEQFNQIAQKYNVKLKSMIEELNSSLDGAHILYANSYALTRDILKNHKSYGFVNKDSACCGEGGREDGKVICKKTFKVCYDRSKYVFWDAYHATDAANLITAKTILDGGSNYMSPMNLSQLLKVHI